MADESSIVSAPFQNAPIPDAPARYRARSRWRLLPLLVLVALGVAARWWWGVRHEPAPLAPLLVEGEHQVLRAIDGDTLELAGDVRIRLLGVDTPETVAKDKPIEPWGPEASAYTKAFVEAGPIRFTFDRERRDRYGRQLAYAWRGDVLLNERLIAAGFSRAKTAFPYSPEMKERFVAAEKEARRKKLGIWSATSGSPTTAQASPTGAAAAR